MSVLTLLLLVAAAIVVTAREYTDEEVSNFPKLFHLDDYDRCLAKKNGLYCLGVFDLTPDVQPNPTYDLLKAYSDESYRHFNRTRIHRGYCVSSRCPHLLQRNASQRFELCADEWARARTLRTSINKLHYCHSYSDKHVEQPMTDAQRIFLQCIVAIIVLNVVGTIYDVYSDEKPDKNKLIRAFSMPANWKRLTVIHEGGDPRLTAFAPLNGLRVLAMTLTTFVHTHVFHYNSYLLNPEFLEMHNQRIDGVFVSDGTSLVQALVALACFFTTYNLLMYSQKRPLSLTMLPLCIFKRLIRLSPVHLLIVGYAATWWLNSRDGPLVPTTIGLESGACQTKFWSHVFYMNNIVDRANYCVAPSWFLPVDLHMYIITCSFTLVMWRHRKRALKLYGILFLASCIFCGIIAYIKEYKSIVYISTPENIRRLFREVPSFTDFYISSWGALPACFIGLLIGHIQFELDEKRSKFVDNKLLVLLQYISFLLLFLWPLTGQLARSFSSPMCYAIYLAVDRPLFCIFGGMTLLTLVNIESSLRKFFSWNGWIIIARISLPVMLLHWCINMTITARPIAFGTSMLDITVDWISTNFITCLLAIPITLLVEIPMQKFMGLLIT